MKRFGDGNHVDRLALSIQVLDRREDDPVTGCIEIAGSDLSHDTFERVLIKHQRAEDGLLGFN